MIFLFMFFRFDCVTALSTNLLSFNLCFFMKIFSTETGIFMLFTILGNNYSEGGFRRGELRGLGDNQTELF